jgi:hypothetical protein
MTTLATITAAVAATLYAAERRTCSSRYIRMTPPTRPPM